MLKHKGLFLYEKIKSFSKIEGKFMPHRKNYLKYYKKTYLKNQQSSIKKRIIVFFVLVMFITILIVFYIFVRIESSNEENLNETSLAMNQAVSVKKKKLRTDFNAWNRSAEWNLVVINNVNEIPPYFSPNLKQCGDIEVDEKIVTSLNEMVQEANKNGIKIWVSSGYRSKERQEQLFNKEVEKNLKSGLAKEEAFNLALKTISLPGFNEHNTGLSVDFNAAGKEFSTTKDYDWLLENCVNYGFILRYPEEKESLTERAFEPAHFRYVGEEHAKAIKAQNLCLEEYVSSLIK